MFLDVISLSWPALLLVGSLAMAALGLCLLGNRWVQRYQRRRRWTRAQTAEATAPRLLQRQGYDVLGAQVEGSYTLVVDGEATAVLLRADYLVSRDGKHFIAEVKSGKRAPSLGNPATRRQLLEYLMAFDVAGVLLVDGETERIHEVVFPLRLHDAQSSYAGVLAAVVTVFGLVAAVFYLLRFF